MLDWKAFGLNALQSFFANVALGGVGTYLRTLPIERLNGFLIRLGRAFGPPNIKHFSELSPDEQQALLIRVPVLNTTHTDYLKPFQFLPRTLTTWVGPAPEFYQVIMGNVTPPLKPIPKPGEWYVLRGYMASTTAEGIHDRLGWRFDDVNLYYDLSVALKKV